MERNIEQWQHHHSFGTDKKHIERKTLVVVIITLVAMVAEIVFGLISHSMALFADGVHMGTHAFALGISLAAYIFARRHSQNSKFTFGTWKIEILGAFASALTLGIVAVMMVYSSINRIIHPEEIYYNQALLVAVLGLVVNVVCAFILSHGEHHHHHHGHDHDEHRHHHHDHDDLNLKSAYLHVVADAMTSVFAIIALLGAKYYHVNVLDPVMGIVGALLIARWAVFLLRDSAMILLDYHPNDSLSLAVKAAIESDGFSRVSDLHLWKVSDSSYSCIVAVVSRGSVSAEELRSKLKSFSELAHVTVEINNK